MSSYDSASHADQVESLSSLHNRQGAGGQTAKLAVGHKSVSAISTGGGGGGTSDPRLSVEKKQQVAYNDFSEAMGARVAHVETKLGDVTSKLDRLTAMFEKFVVSQQQSPVGAGAGTATSASPAKPSVPVETKSVSSSAFLSAMQEKRLAAAKESNSGAGSKVLDLSQAEHKAISAALDSKVSHHLGSFAGSAGPASSDLEQARLDYDADLLRRERAQLVKQATLGKATNMADLIQRMQRDLVAGVSDKEFVRFMGKHCAQVTRYNDSRSFAAAKYYHYAVFDELNGLKDDEKAGFYLANLNGNAALMDEVNTNPAYKLRREKGNSNNNGSGKPGNHGHGGGGGGFRGKGRGAGRGSTTEGTGSASDKKPGVV